MLDYDEQDRAAFDAALMEALTAALPDATLSWAKDGRRLTATFPDGRQESIWEPNFYFCRGVHYPDRELFSRAAQHLAGAQANAEAFGRLVRAAPALLAACKAAHDALLTFERLGLLQQGHEQQALDQIRTALAMAHGE